MGVHIDKSVPTFIRTASEHRVRCIGKAYLYVKHHDSDKWVPIQFLVIRQAKVLILSNKDLKRLKLLEHRFPHYIDSNKQNTHSETTSDTSDGESVYSVKCNVSDTVRPVSNTVRPVTDEKVNTYSNVSTDTQQAGNENTPPDGPRIQQMFSEPIEVQID